MHSVNIFNFKDKPKSFYSIKSDCLFYDTAWIEVLEKTYGFRFFTAINQETQNYMILAFINNNFEKKLISLPFSDYVKLERNTWAEDEVLLKAIEKEFPGVPITYKSTHPDIPENSWGIPFKKAYYHRIPTNNKDSLANLQKPTFMNKVRQAKKKGVEVRVNREKSAVNTFYNLYYELRISKFSSIPQPLVFFENIYKSFIKQGAGFFMEALYEEKVIASFLVLQSKNVLYHKSGCSSLEYLKLRPNNLLYDSLMEYAINNNIEFIDLGLSGSSEAYAGLVKFKESMGGQRNEINVLGNKLAKEKLNSESPSHELVSSITEILVKEKADIKLINKLSEIIYPFFA